MGSPGERAADDGEVRVRPLEPRDHARVLALNAASVVHLSPLDPDRLAALVSMASFAVVAETAGDVVAFAVAFEPGTAYDSENYRWWSSRADDFVYLDRIVVAEEARGRGIASLLYDRLEDWARPRGAVVAEIDVEPPNEPSLRFHAGRGYVEHGRREGPGKTVSMVRLDLPPSPAADDQAVGGWSTARSV